MHNHNNYVYDMLGTLPMETLSLSKTLAYTCTHKVPLSELHVTVEAKILIFVLVCVCFVNIKQ